MNASDVEEARPADLCRAFCRSSQWREVISFPDLLWTKPKAMISPSASSTRDLGTRLWREGHQSKLAFREIRRIVLFRRREPSLVQQERFQQPFFCSGDIA